MMRQKSRKLINILKILVLISVLLVIKQLIETPNILKNNQMIVDDPFVNVKKYRPLLEEELEKYKLEEYTVVLVAIMQQESRRRRWRSYAIF